MHITSYNITTSADKCMYMYIMPNTIMLIVHVVINYDNISHKILIYHNINLVKLLPIGHHIVNLIAWGIDHNKHTYGDKIKR